MKKRVLSLTLALVLCLGLAAPALALAYGEEYADYTADSSQQYRDVPETHWAFQSIDTCSQRAWFNGYPDGTFRPEGLITREEAAKVFAVALGLELEDNPVATYTDTRDNWAKAYIEATKPLFPNVANLQGTASFRPTQTITREETIYALVVAWGYGSKTTNADLSVLNMFSDTNSISVEVKPYLAVAVSEALVSGLPDGTIAAQKGLTRAEFATLLARALSHGYGDTKQEFQAPKITLDQYSSTTDKATLAVTGSVTPADAAVTLDGNDVRVFKGSFSVELELKVGSNSFTLTAENAYGTKAAKTITVERTDELAISIDPFETSTRAEEVTITGTVTPSAGLILTVDGGEVPTTSAGAFHVTLPLVIGANVFDFSARNDHGSTTTQRVKITRKFVAPEPEPEPTRKPEKPSAPPVSDSCDGYVFIYNNKWEKDPDNDNCYLINIVDEDGTLTHMSVTSSLRDAIAADSTSTLSAWRSYNTYVGKFIRIDSVDERAVVSAMTPVVGYGNMASLTELGDGVIRAGGATLDYDDVTRFVYVDLAVTDGRDISDPADDSLEFWDCGTFNPDMGFFHAQYTYPTPMAGTITQANAEKSYDSFQVIMTHEPGSSVAEYVYVLRVCW